MLVVKNALELKDIDCEMFCPSVLGLGIYVVVINN